MSDRMGVDVGGTFTDVVRYSPETGRIDRTKVLTSREQPGEVILEAAKQLGSSPPELGLFIHATTMVTNLIIERRGATVGLITTKGFRDVLEIGWSYRVDPYDLHKEKPPPLVPRPLRREVDERVGADGEVVRPLRHDEVVREARTLVDAGVRSIAVALLHAYANPQHEREVRDVIERELPEVLVSVSSDVDPQIREYERTSSTVLNAYAMPAISSYLDRLEKTVETPKRGTFYMHSGGGVETARRVRNRPIDLVLSGPSAGVIAASVFGKLLGLEDLVTFDTGGTSCDVSLIEGGEIQRRTEFDVEWGVPLRVMAVDVTSVGAGGGSIAWIDSGATLQVGPQSAGAEPGPACYGRGGQEPTVTDANLLIGLLDGDRFLGGRISLDGEAASCAIAPLAAQMNLGAEELAQGVHRIATANMAQAVRGITVQRGVDPRTFTLVAFGGAGGQHAMEVASEVEMRRVLFPPHASTFSAFGLLASNLQTTERIAFFQRLDEDDMAGAEAVFAELALKARTALGLEDETEVSEHRFGHFRYLGQTHELTAMLPGGGWDGATQAFERLHERRYGTRLGDPVEVTALGVTLTRELQALTLPSWSPEEGGAELGAKELVGLGAAVPIYWRPCLATGDRIEGPSVVYETDSTMFVPAGWRASVGHFGELLCEADDAAA